MRDECKCGIARMDCEYHRETVRPTAQENPLVDLWRREFIAWQSEITMLMTMYDAPSLLSEPEDDRYEIKFHDYGNFTCDPPKCAALRIRLEDE